MEYRTLGKTGLKVSALSFGASSLGGVFRPVDESVAIRSVHTALDLGINYIDVAPYYGLTKAETVLELRRIQEQGKARFVGITGYPLRIFRTVLDETGVDTILSYNHYSLNDTSLEALLPYLEEKGVGIISASPVSEGLLTNQGPPAWHPAPEDIRRACAEAVAWVRGRGGDIAQLAIQFSAANPRIHTTCLGSANPENVKKAVRWIEQAPDAEMLEGVWKILAPIRDKTWIAGRPENN